jgi:hypothetical protein
MPVRRPAKIPEAILQLQHNWINGAARKRDERSCQSRSGSLLSIWRSNAATCSRPWEVYGYDAEARERGLSPEERLRFHQEHSHLLMDNLHAWLEAQFAERQTEPNSGLGKAITCPLRHWKGADTILAGSAGASG